MDTQAGFILPASVSVLRGPQTSGINVCRSPGSVGRNALRTRSTPAACSAGRQVEGGRRDRGHAVSVGGVRVGHAASDEDRRDVLQLWERHGIKNDDDDESHETEYVVARTSRGRAAGAGRFIRRGNNVELDRVIVSEGFRGRGVGRKIVEQLMAVAAPISGAVYVESRRSMLGFYSLLGFETQGHEYVENREYFRHMVYRFPVCSQSSDCVGLHHTAIRVVDIERSLGWYGGVGFTVAEKFFTPSGERACFVEGLGVRLELVESSTGSGLSGVQDWPGFLVFDVTRGCSDLDSFLQHLQKRNGGYLSITRPPAQQVVGSTLQSCATVEDPDGLPIEFIRREGSVPQALLRRVDW